MAQQFFKLGEERFGLIVASQGEGEQTRYGFAIQPIQEYFTSAFISNQISPDLAHQVFESMLHRPYWKEVALFLAGLRRPNEKADLIARAKHIDEDRVWGWRVDGRAIILQLLLEGVFSEPRYVFSQALEFIIDLIDTNKVPIQHEPPNLLASLEILLTGYTYSESHQKRIVELLQENVTCEDQYIMMRLFHVAKSILPKELFFTAVMGYRGTSINLLASIRFRWPYKWKLDINQLTQNPSFWLNVPDQTWAEIWWNEAINCGIALDIHAPAKIHQNLVEQFAINPINIFPNHPGKVKFIEVESNLAIWKMLQYQQILPMLMLYRSNPEPSYFGEKLKSIYKDDLNVEYIGLDKPLKTMIKEILSLSQELINLYSSKDDSLFTKAWEKYIQVIYSYLGKEGLQSWIACRCLINYIYSRILWEPFYIHEIRNIEVESVSLGSIVKMVNPYFEGSSIIDNLGIEQRYFRRNMYINDFSSPFIIDSRIAQTTPTNIRVEDGAKLVSIVEILVNIVKKGNDFPFEWMRYMPYSTGIIRPTIEKCRNSLPELLRVLGKLTFNNKNLGLPLRVQDTQRLLKIARNTDDVEILSGIAISLTNSNFIRIAEQGLIQKLLHINPNSLFARSLFNRGSLFPEEVSYDSQTKDIQIIETIAVDLLKNPDNFPFETICLAADFLVEHRTMKLPPLANDEENLGLEIIRN